MTDLVRLIATPENMGAKGRLYSVAVDGGPTLGKSRDPLFAGAPQISAIGVSDGSGQPETPIAVHGATGEPE